MAVLMKSQPSIMESVTSRLEFVLLRRPHLTSCLYMYFKASGSEHITLHDRELHIPWFTQDGVIRRIQNIHGPRGEKLHLSSSLQ
jgi:hypothetical protein